MDNIIKALNESYPIDFNGIEMIRDMGSTSYAAFSESNKYFLRVIKPAFFDSAIAGANVQVFLQNEDFPVPPVVSAKKGLPYAKTEDKLLILYNFIEGSDCEPERDAEAIGALLGKLHQIMKRYSNDLVKRDKHFYIGRYIEILREKQYPRINEYIAYSDALWEEIKDLPRGYCHGDMYSGNIRKASDGKLYIHDFDTSCEGFPAYDTALICNMTEYFNYDGRNYYKSNQVLSRFVPAYRKHNILSQSEINAFYALIAVQHFSTQATVMEIFGIDCICSTDIDNQLEWLYKWRKQYKDEYETKRC